MRKNAPRKWIHAILDLLPILVIPIFAININQKEIEPITAQVEESEIVDFNQLSPYIDYEIYRPVEGTYYNELFTFQAYDNHLYVFRYEVDPAFINNDGSLYYQNYDAQVDRYSLFTDRYLTQLGDGIGHLRYAITENYTSDTSYIKFNVYDVSQMFGVGNEPTFEQFIQWYPYEYYEYTISKKEILYTGNNITLNNTDIGSQFLYSMYTPVKDYFNFNQLFNMQNVYDWLQVNLFNGMAPVPVFIVWNIIVYEFFIDLIFLLYTVFMFFIDFATNMIDSFTGRCK